MSLRPIRRALLSVSDKAGLADLARTLTQFNVELISTGGTRKALTDASFAVVDISEVTGFPEILDGRVKTLHPKVHGGILAKRDDDKHMATIADQEIAPIDLVVCNLYPFEATVAKPNASHDEIVENIDIGGPSMVRSASKNYHDVAVATDPRQYAELIQELEANDGALTLATRERLAAEAFARTAAYDQAIQTYFASRQQSSGDKKWPAMLHLSFRHHQDLRYGENSHQRAAFYVEPGCTRPSVAVAEQLVGKELSFNNILDVDSAFNLACEFSQPAAAVIKHTNPCGAAVGATLAEAFDKAYEGDPKSAYGGILGFNRDVDEATAERIVQPGRFIECIIAPGYSDAAVKKLTSWLKNLRLLKTGPLQAGYSDETLDYRRVDGGLLVQTRDRGSADFADLQQPTKRKPTDQEMADLQFAWTVVKHVKSNAIVLAKNNQLIAAGAGQMSRVDSVEIAVKKAGDKVKGCALASDAFFPFRDNIDAAAAAGVTALIQPEGAKRQKDVIAACDEHGLAMVLTQYRHFRH